jgi:hypothetical protein
MTNENQRGASQAAVEKMRSYLQKQKATEPAVNDGR